MLCSGFILRIMLITHQCFSCCSVALTAIKDFSVSHALPVRRGTGNQEGAEIGHLTQTSHRGIPYRRTSCLVYKLGGDTQKGLITAQGWDGHWLAGGEQLCCASLVFIVGVSVPYPLLVFYLSPCYFPSSNCHC